MGKDVDPSLRDGVQIQATEEGVSVTDSAGEEVELPWWARLHLEAYAERGIVIPPQGTNVAESDDKSSS